MARPSDITMPALALACSDMQRMMTCVSYAAQLGVSGIIPFTCENSPEWARSAASAHECICNLATAADSAAREAGTAAPVVEDPVSFEELCSRFSDFERVAFCWESADATSATVPEAVGAAASVLVVIGPVEGFAPDEAARAQAAGARCVTLGPGVLDVEAACVAAIALASHAHALNGDEAL